MTRPRLALIAAVARNGAIGMNNSLPWSDPEDRRFFRRVTMGCPVVMGRKTWDSLPERFRPLPGRRNIVLTRSTSWCARGAEVANSIESALALLDDAKKVFVIGGADVYSLALPVADELVLTEIDSDLEGDTYFPSWDRSAFRLESRESHTSASGVPFSFAIYKSTRGS
jgi:dihydrofolate reductase